MNSTALTQREVDGRVRRSTQLSWILVALYVLWVAGLRVLTAHVVPLQAVSYIEQGILVAFFVSHALVYYTAVEVVVFAVANIVVSNVFENLSIVTGFPFGFYQHNVGPKLFHVPYLVTLIYLGMGYISWMVAQVLLRRTSYRSWERLVWVGPLIAAFVFTCWDLCIDPIYGTIYRAFTYKNPGVWFGTPGGNYFGWLVTTYLFYLPFSLYLSRRGGVAQSDREEPGRSYWLQSVLMYLAVAAGILLVNASGAAADITVANGKVWNTGDIYGASTLVTLFTMVFVGVLALLSLREICSNQRP